VALTPGTHLGPYEILSALGAGGMGQVYRAHDTKLNRDVALKVLSDLFASDPDRLARFTREAQTLASLNHPNIAHIHGLEESNGVRALVMELVEGEDLSQRIARGALPLDDALPIARQIAEALEAAHEQGIIHRDLKPANVKVRSDGMVKVLDFGLAKAMESAGAASPNVSQSPTITTPAMTQAGMILGTAAYMSPEQARGRAVDKRSDVWAFGCVLYEMFTGKRAFSGEDVSETLAAVLRGEPDWTALPRETPAPIRRLLRRCLTKDAKGRIGDASIARIEIDEVENGPHIDGEVVQNTSRHRERIAWVSALALVTLMAAAGALVWLHAFAPSVPLPPEMRLEILTPSTPDPISFAISPDGRRLVFAASGDGQPRLWLRPLEAVIAQPLAGTEGAAYPFWSPDVRRSGFLPGAN
jgi:serine/threonine protein kinase